MKPPGGVEVQCPVCLEMITVPIKVDGSTHVLTVYVDGAAVLEHAHSHAA